MFHSVEEMFSWTLCSEDCKLDVYRGKLPLRESMACCIWDRIYTLVRHLNWSVCYQYADAAQVGQFATIDDLIEDFRLNYAVIDYNK